MKHTAEDADWDNYVLRYKTAYQKDLAGNGRSLDHLTDEERFGNSGQSAHGGPQPREGVAHKTARHQVIFRSHAGPGKK